METEKAFSLAQADSKGIVDKENLRTKRTLQKADLLPEQGKIRTFVDVWFIVALGRSKTFNVLSHMQSLLPSQPCHSEFTRATKEGELASSL